MHSIDLHRKQQPREAIETLGGYLGEHPQSLDGWNTLGCILAETNCPKEALSAFTASLGIDPSQAEIHFRRARMHAALNHTSLALAHFNQAIKLRPEFIEAYLQISLILRKEGRHMMARNILAFVLKLHPFHPKTVSMLAAMNIEIGRKEEARRLCKDAIFQHPDSEALFCQWAALEDLKPSNPLVARMEKRYPCTGASPADQLTLALSLAQIHGRVGNIAASFRYYEDKNRRRAEVAPYDEPKMEALFAAVKEVGAEAPPPHHCPPSDPIPVFIVGMPRSGTTLVEHILDCHDELYGAGELPYINDLVHTRIAHITGKDFPESLRVLDETHAGAYAALGAEYLDRLKAIGGGARLVCDKMPHNFFYIGLIRRMLPDARIIHCRRNPMDTCFSILTSNFVSAHPYANDQAALGRYYRLYEDLMLHWDLVYPGAIYTLRYESLVENLEPEARKLLDYCGLEWDARCLDFPTNPRIVKTASSEQVRMPIYTTSIGKWKAYAPYLASLKEALGVLTAP